MVGQVVRVTTTAMMTPMHRALLALSLAAVVTLTACGGDSEDTDTLSGDEQKAARSLAAESQGKQPTAAQAASGHYLGDRTSGGWGKGVYGGGNCGGCQMIEK